AKAGSRMKFADLFLGARLTLHPDIEITCDADVESVPAPFTLTHDRFAGCVVDQANVWADFLASRIVATAHDYLEVFVIFEFTVDLFKQLRGKIELFDCFNNGVLVRDDLRHALVILRSGGKINQ